MKKRIFALLAILFLLSALPMRAYAQSTIDLTKKGSITVKVIDDGTPLTNLKLTCIRVGALELVDGEYEYVRVYDDKILTGEIYSQTLAKELLTFVQDNSSNYKFTQLEERVSKTGYAKFNNCIPGLYLIYQEDSYSLNGKKYDKISAFLVTVPYNGKYDVDASSKPALDLFPPDPPPTTKPSERLPQTGQLNWPVPMLASSGMLLFALGWLLRRDEGKDGYEA